MSDRPARASRSPGLLRALFGLAEGLGIDLVQQLEFSDLELLKNFAIAFDFDLGRLLDPVKVLVVSQRDFEVILAALKSLHPGGHPDGEAALLVEGERELLAIGARHLDDD